MSFNPSLTKIDAPEVQALLKNHYKVGDEYTLGPDQVGTIIGFGKKYIGRGGFDHKYAGVYIDFSVAVVAPDNGQPDTGCHLCTEADEISDINIRISDLPETPFWEGDRVVLRDDLKHGAESNKSMQWIVRKIGYNHLKSGRFYCHASKMQQEGRPNSNHDVSDYIGQFALLGHGNLWKMEHGEPMKFASIDEEAAFYKSLGMSRNVTEVAALEYRKLAEATEFNNAKEEQNFYASMTATFQEAIKALRKGNADEMKLREKEQMTFVVIKYDNEEFGKRMRAHTLAKFGLADEVSA